MTVGLPLPMQLTYDRASLGRSDAGPTPRTSETTVSELRALLTNAGIAGPYVLVGHSIGGFHVQLLARQDGGRSVTGVVLVDATPIDFPEVGVRFGFRAPAPSENPEGLDIPASARELKAAPAFPNLPLAVLTHAIPPPGAPAELEQAWQEMQLGQSRLSPEGELVVAECAGHYIQLNRPDLVIAAIARVSSLSAPSQPGGGGCNTPPPLGSSTPPPPGADGPNTPSRPAGDGATTSPPPDSGAPAPFADCPPVAANVIRGSARSNSLVGTSRGDRIFAGAGNDLVDGGAGEDCIDLGPGTDRGRGGSGADLFLGGHGRDRMSGSAGNDRLRGGASADRLIGGPGEDRLSGSSGSDTISGRDRRRDRINCGGGRDKVIADGVDRVSGNCERVRRR